MDKIAVKTERLTLTPRTVPEVAALRDSETDGEMKKAYGEMVETMHKLPGREEWGAEWKIELNGEGVVIGGIGFKGAPDEKGNVEVGYGIDEAYRRRGYATEAVGGLVRWATTQEGVRCVNAQTEEDNKVSQKVLQKNGFVRDGYGEEGPLFRVMREWNGKTSGRPG